MLFRNIVGDNVKNDERIRCAIMTLEGRELNYLTFKITIKLFAVMISIQLTSDYNAFLFSGVELEDKVLSVEQHSLDKIVVEKKKKKMKRAIVINKEVIEEKSPPKVKLKTESSSPVYEYNFANKAIIKSEGPYIPLNFGPSSPRLDSSSDTISMRCPWIPYPMHDAEIKKISSLEAPFETSVPLGVAGDATIRSPNVPEPTIDKILSFEDLSFPELYDQDLEFDDSYSAPGSEHSSDETYGVLHEFQNAISPTRFLYKYDALKMGIAKDLLSVCAKDFPNLIAPGESIDVIS